LSCKRVCWALFTSWNQGAERIYGYKAEDVIGRSLLVPLLIHSRVEGVLYASNLTTRPFTERDEETLGRLAVHAALAIQNAQLYYQAQAKLAERQRAEAALSQAASELEQRVEARTDALCRAMAERRRLEREAQRAQHLALLGRLAAGVSHEIRNPLAAVFLNMDALDDTALKMRLFRLILKHVAISSRMEHA
jgi:PAS domain S-box-containing protein